MNVWMAASMATLGLWAAWGVFAKMATRHGDAATLLLAQGVGNIVVYVAVATWVRFKLDARPTGLALGIAAGLAGTLGTLTFLYALSKGRASVVVPVTALYPFLVALIAVTALGEPLTWKVGVGTALAVLAVVVFAL